MKSQSLKRLLLCSLAVCIITLSSLAQSPQPSPAMQQANVLFQAQKWAEAAQAYEAVVKDESDNPQAWYRLGLSRHSLGKFESAIEAFQKCVALKGNNQAFALYNIACGYARLNEKDKAIEWLKRAIDAGFPGGRGISTDNDLASLHNDARFKEILDTVAKQVTPCLFSTEHRQFDFWVGEWDVMNPQGQRVGTNSVQKILDGCLILENWTDMQGGSGKSFNYYSAATSKWYQRWVSSQGNVLELAGEYKDGALRYEGVASARMERSCCSG